MRRAGELGLAVLLAALAMLAVTGFKNGEENGSPPLKFATWNGLGPDKWASIWLADRYLNPNVRVALVPEGSNPKGYILIDTPGSRYLRDTESSTFAKLQKSFRPEGPGLARLKRVIRDIEVNMWLPDKDPASLAVEQAYRSLQQSYGRTRVPYNCYMQFFDKAAAWLSEQDDGTEVSDISEYLEPPQNCAASAELGDDKQKLIPELAIASLLDLVRSGKEVVFVDVREPEEFAESHIPGAINLQIRDLSEETVGDLKAADIIVSYCVKDFRGFEMAKKLQRYGFDNTVILKPYGLKGWISTGMPVYKQGGDSEQDALREFRACLDRDAACRAII